MKKISIALAILGTTTAMAGAAHAQSNVRIYGLLDNGYVKEGGVDARMGANYGNYIGFAGEEDLGNGLKAVFTLEKWFEPNIGTHAMGRNRNDEISAVVYNINTKPAWQGQAYVGLTSTDWGSVKFGRVANLAYEKYRKFDPFDIFGIGHSLIYGSNLFAEMLSNTARYDSPAWNSFSFAGSYSLGGDDRHVANLRGISNDGYNASLNYNNGPLNLTANYYKLADSNNSWSWNLAGGYAWEDITLSLGYDETKFKLVQNILNTDVRQRGALLALKWAVASGEIAATYNYARWKEPGNSYKGDVHKYSLGYTYQLSRRTAIYGILAYMNSDDGYVAQFYNLTGATRADAMMYQLGLRHSF